MNGEVIEGSIKMRCKTLAKLFAVSLVILTSSPALATQLAHHDAHCSSSKQNAGVCLIGHSAPASRVRAARRVGAVGIQRTMIGRPT